MTHPPSEAGTSVEVKSFDERLKEIVQKVVDDAELRVVTMKPTYDSVDLGLALLRPLLIQPTPAETEGVVTDEMVRAAIADFKRGASLGAEARMRSAIHAALEARHD